jgi:hypothetical protein
MEAYCNAMCALENKFYGIELNYIPLKYNEEADELAKVASGRITVPPNVFARDVTKSSVDLSQAPSSGEEPPGAPSNPAGAEPMDEDPSNKVFVLSLLEGYDVVEAEAMETESAPTRRIGGPNTSPGSIEGSSRQIEPRPGASPGRPNHSP